MKITTKPARALQYAQIAAAAVLCILFATADTHAQVFSGGGGAGLFQSIIQWLVTNILTGLIMVAILIAGARLLFGHRDGAAIMIAAVGALVITHYDQIASLFSMG